MSIKSFKTFILEEQSFQNWVFNMAKPGISHKSFHNNLKKDFGTEYPIIINAARRNNIKDDDYENLSLLFAIRRAENGKMGREFGVLTKEAGLKPNDTRNDTLDRQAGWASASILKNRNRYKETDQKMPFIDFMANRWAPVGAGNDPKNLNINWSKNTSKFQNKYLSSLNLSNVVYDDYGADDLEKPTPDPLPEAPKPNIPQNQPFNPPKAPLSTDTIDDSKPLFEPLSSPVIPPLLDEKPKKKK